jgi:hypothetical protein
MAIHSDPIEEGNTLGDQDRTFHMEHSPGFMAIKTKASLSYAGAEESGLSELSNYPSYRPWLLDTATSYFMCSERSAMIEYYEYALGDERPLFETSNGNMASTEAYGKCVIQLERDL